MALALANSAGGRPSAAFHFEPRTLRLDWRLLAELDPDRLMADTDIDGLERALDTVCFGDISVEDPRVLSGARRARDASLSAQLRSQLPCRRKRCEALQAGPDDGGVPALRAGAPPQGT